MFPYQQTDFYSENQKMPSQYWESQHCYNHQNQYFAPNQVAHVHSSYNYNDQVKTEVTTIHEDPRSAQFVNFYGVSAVRDIKSDQNAVHASYNVNNQECHPLSTSELFPSIKIEYKDQIPIDYGNHGVPCYPDCNTLPYTPLTPEPVTYPVFQLPKPNNNCNGMAKKHRAQISLVPTSTGNFKAIVKQKRKRTVFTTEQVNALEEIFKKKQYISREDRQIIVEDLQLNDKSVKIWFQNRRLKGKKNTELQVPEPVEERSSPVTNPLDNMECQITEKTNAYGYVTLDDGVMGNLVNAIDDYLTNTNKDVVNSSESNTDVPIYEPISPASISDSSEVASPFWKPAEPNESLQRLFDLQMMLSL